jgi:chitodextrinase
MSGNDFQSWPNPGDDAVVQAVARGIHDTDDRHIHTVELDYSVSGSLDDPSWAPLIELNASYTYYPTYAQVLADYNRPNALPTFMVEANYEFEHNAADLGTPEILRRQAYWALLSGAAGQLYGNRYTWPFIDGWQDNLDTPGSAQMTLVKFLFEPRQWWNLIPDQTHTVVTAGYGTFADGGALGDNDYATAARTPDGALVMTYLPTVRTVTVDMTKLGAAVHASWYDPTDGGFDAIAGSPFANSGTRDFTPPGTHGDGSADWVLVLEATGLPPDTTPPSVPSGLGTTGIAGTEIDLAWTASTDDVGVAGYRVYRDGVLVKTTAATTWADTGLTPSTAYSYTVAAFDYATNASNQSAPLGVSTSAPGPTFVQQSYATPQTPESVVAATYVDAETAGDTNIVAIGWNDTTASITSVVDAAGNVYQPAIATFRGNGLSQAIYYAANVAAAAAGANPVTVTFDQPAVFVDLRITEYAGLRASAPFDAGASASGSGTNAATGNVTTSTASELLFAAGMTSAVFTAPGAGYTSRVITSPDGDLVEDTLAASPGGHAATASLGGGTWLLQVAAFRPGP